MQPDFALAMLFIIMIINNNDKVYQFNRVTSDFLELWWADGGLCVRINGSDIAVYNPDRWK